MVHGASSHSMANFDVGAAVTEWDHRRIELACSAWWPGREREAKLDEEKEKERRKERFYVPRRSCCPGDACHR